MLVDSVDLVITAGRGGNGASSFLMLGPKGHGGPDGGNGGNGGSIFFQGSNNVNDLREFRFKKSILADDGVAGKKKNLYGRNADDKIVFVPLGTQITDSDSGKVFEIVDTTTPILLARGGKGGRGNTEFKSSINQAPRFAEKGTMGEHKNLHLELKLIAQIGLIGLPNAGKSSLLSVLTHAHPLIADYPFTTLEPNIGMLDNYAIADIPGLIEGASSGKGLGFKFLKHIEKTRIIVHCIDVTSENPQKTYEIVRNEFEKYNSILLEKPEIILFTKTDLIDEKTLDKRMKLFKKTHTHVMSVSSYDDEKISKLKKELISFLTNGQKSQ